MLGLAARFRALLLVLIAAPGLYLPAGQALGHAVLLGTVPANDAVLDTAPEILTLTFNEPVAPLKLMLVDPQGTTSDLGTGVGGGSELSVPLPERTLRGTHVLSWRVVSDDGHPIGGALVFSVGSVTRAGEIDTSDPRLGALIWFVRTVFCTALLFGIGGAVFCALTRPFASGGRIPRTAALVALLAAPLMLGLQGADALALSPISLFSSTPWRVATGTSLGVTALLALLAASLALASLRLPRGTARAAAVAALVMLGAAFASSGHAASASPQLLTRALVLLHVTAVSLWIGALPPLLFALGRAEGTSVLRLFSVAIPWVMLALLGSGLALAAVQLGTELSAWPSAYGYVLAAKLTVAALLLLLAAHNRWRLSAPAMVGDGRSVDELRRVIRLEIALIVVVLALVAAWRFTPPPRALAQLSNEPVGVHLHAAEMMADVTIAPGRAGAVSAEITLYPPSAEAPPPQAVTLALSSSALGIERIEHVAVRSDRDTWRIDELTIPVAGAWELELGVRVSRFERVRLGGLVDIR